MKRFLAVRRLWIRCTAAAAVAVLVAPVAVAQPDRPGPRPRGTAGAANWLTEGNPALGKVSSELLEARWTLRERGLAALATPRRAGGWVVSSPVTSRTPVVTVRLDRLDDEILARLKAAGLEVSTSSARWAQAHGRVDLDRLDELAEIAEVSTVRASRPPIRSIGDALSQADASIMADTARSTYGVDGTGVDVGILSDSFNATRSGTDNPGACDCTTFGNSCSRTVTGMLNQTTGPPADLPSPVTMLDDCDLAPGGFCTGLSDEGAAMGELTYDLAPGIGIMFHSAFNSEIDFADGITELANCGADVIVDDVFYPEEPMFQNGPIAQAAQDAVDAGVPYFSSAGNQGTTGIDDMYVDFDLVNNGGFAEDFHDFDSGDAYAEVILPSGCKVTFVLQWNDPWSGALGPGAASDFDLYFCDAADDDCAGVVASSTTMTGCGGDMMDPDCSGDGMCGDPIEIIGPLDAEGGAATGYLVVDKFCGAADHIRVATFTSCFSPVDFEDGEAGENPIFVDNQIYGHAAAAGAVAVAASYYEEIDSGGTEDPPSGQIDVEPFSSLGGDVPIYFDSTGSPVASPPELRAKPEITAPDGTDNTFFGGDSDGSGFPNFFGTSAAAPHAAAVAALMLEADGSATPAQILQVLTDSALDIEAPGVDDLSGAGLIQAFDAVAAAACNDDGVSLGSTPSPAAFGGVALGRTKTLELTHANTSCAPVATMVTAYASSDGTVFPADETAGSTPCGTPPFALPSWTSCNSQVSFTPAAEGDVAATLDLTASNAPNESIPLSGTGVDCDTSSEVTLSSQTISEEVVSYACETLILGGSLIVDGDGDLTGAAGSTVKLVNGVSIETGAEVALGTDPALLTPPSL